MDVERKKLNKIMNELVGFLFSIGADHIQMELNRLPEGYRATICGNFQPENRHHVEHLERFLRPTIRNEGLEEFCWELAGTDSSPHDSELHLIGQMVDCEIVEIGERDLKLVFFRHTR